MPEFLQLFPPGEARALLYAQLPIPGPIRFERVEVVAGLDRVTAFAIRAPESLPAFTRSTVDGFAVRSMDTFGATEGLPAYLRLCGEVPMGRLADIVLTVGQTAGIHTGGMVPEGSDAVVMLEYCQSSRSGEVEVVRAVAPGENIILPGEDIREGDVVLNAGIRLRPAQIGGLMALGITWFDAAARPVVGILSSGDEIVPPEKRPQSGHVRDINSYSLSSLIEQSGGIAQRYGILPDSFQALCSGLEKALTECDLVVVTAGSSASVRDLTASAITAVGEPGVLVHGVNVRPGKPTILGVCGGKAVVGLPGNPVSALVIADLFVRPLVGRLLGLADDFDFRTVHARVSTNLPSQAGREDYIPVRLRREPDGWMADPIFFKSNLIFSLARADGLAHVPADANGISAGAWVEVSRI